MKTLRIFACFLTALLLLPPLGRARAQESVFPVTAEDAAGRTVTIEGMPERIFLGEGLQLLSLALVHPDPVGLLALWKDDLKTYDPATYANLVSAFPALEDVPTVGGGGGLSLEAVLAAEPDLAILSLWQKPETEALVAQLEALGIPVVFIDFYNDPIENTPASMELLGTILGRPDRGEAFAAFYRERLKAVKVAVSEAQGEPPSVLLQAYPGLWACCWSAGAEGFGAFLDFAGGHNIGAERLPTPDGGNLNLEYIIASAPEVYIATGLSSAESEPGLQIGSNVSPDVARESLKEAVAASGLPELPAVRNGRVYGLWNYFNGTPFNILAIEAMAKWLHPESTGQIDPAETLAVINERFLAAPLDGTFWISLHPQTGTGEAAEGEIP